MKPLILIPARAGSKRLPHKNSLLCAGVPLIRRAVDTALEADVGPVVVSTDCERCKAAVFGHAEIIDRPSELAQDNTPMIDVVRHAVEGRDNDPVILLQCTNPFVTAADLRGAYEKFLGNITLPVAARPGGFWVWTRRFLSFGGSWRNLHDAWAINPSIDIDTQDHLTMAEILLAFMEK